VNESAAISCGKAVEKTGTNSGQRLWKPDEWISCIVMLPS